MGKWPVWRCARKNPHRKVSEVKHSLAYATTDSLIEQLQTWELEPVLLPITNNTINYFKTETQAAVCGMSWEGHFLFKSSHGSVQKDISLVICCQSKSVVHDADIKTFISF